MGPISSILGAGLRLLDTSVPAFQLIPGLDKLLECSMLPTSDQVFVKELKDRISLGDVASLSERQKISAIYSRALREKCNLVALPEKKLQNYLEKVQFLNILDLPRLSGEADLIEKSIESILCSIDRIPNKDWVLLQEAMEELFPRSLPWSLQKLQCYAECLDSMARSPHSLEKEEFIAAFNFMIGISSGWGPLLFEIVNLPKKTEVLRLASILRFNLSSGLDRVRLLRYVQFRNEKEIEQVLWYAKELIFSYCYSSSVVERCRIVEQILACDTEEREEVVHCVKLVMRGVDEELVGLIECIRGLGVGKRSTVAETVARLKPLVGYNDVIQNLMVLFWMRKEEEWGFMISMIGEILVEYDPQKIQMLVVVSLFFLPNTEETWKSLRQFVDASIGQIDHFPEFLFQFFKANPQVKAASHAFLMKALEEGAGRVLLASQICDRAFEIHLSHEDPIVQRAWTLCSQEDSRYKNPYVIQRQVEQFALQKTPPIAMPVKIYRGRRYVFRPAFFLDLPLRSVTKAEISSRVNGNTLELLFSRLEGRLADPERKRRVDQYIGEISDEKTLSSLKLNFALDPCLRALWILPERDEEPVSHLTAVLYKLIDLLLDKNDGVAEGALLSEREEALLNLAATVNACPTGKVEALVRVYNLLSDSQKYRSIKKPLDAPGEEISRRALQMLAQEVIHRLLSIDGTLMKKMVGIKEAAIAEFPHQAMYVKNCIARHIGLKHDIQFDFHAGLIYDRLLDRSLEEMLQIFYRELKADDFIDALCQKVEQDIAEGNAEWFSVCNQVLELDHPEDRAKFWETDEEGRVKLCKASALAIWLKMGLIEDLAARSALRRWVERMRLS